MEDFNMESKEFLSSVRCDGNLGPDLKNERKASENALRGENRGTAPAHDTAEKAAIPKDNFHAVIAESGNFDRISATDGADCDGVSDMMLHDVKIRLCLSEGLTKSTVSVR
jgi:hypothetical protein